MASSRAAYGACRSETENPVPGPCFLNFGCDVLEAMIYLEHDKSENTSQWHFFTFFRMVQKYRRVVEAVLDVIAFCTI